MPATSWFRKLRGRRRWRWKGKRSPPSSVADEDVAVSAGEQRSRCRAEPRTEDVAAYSCSPNRASYYFSGGDRDGGLRCIATRDRHDDGGAAALDIRVDVVAVRLGGIDAPPVTPELNLPPVITRSPAAKKEPRDGAGGGSSSSGTATSAATTPSTRARGFHVKPAGRRRRRRQGHDDDDDGARKEPAPAPEVGTRRRRRRWLYESLVVVMVKESSDPEQEMAEMVVANGIVSPEDLEELLACYLALHASDHHRAVVAAFRRLWLWLHLASPQRS